MLYQNHVLAEEVYSNNRLALEKMLGYIDTQALFHVIQKQKMLLAGHIRKLPLRNISENGLFQERATWLFSVLMFDPFIH